MIDLDNCRFLVWGFTRRRYDTMTHIMEAFYRTLKKSGKDVEWLDESSPPAPDSLKNTFVITEHRPALMLPIRNDCFYAIHGGNDYPECREKFGEVPNHLSWGVFLSYPDRFAQPNFDPGGHATMIDEEVPFYPWAKRMNFRWAADLTPEEIQANKPDKMLGRDSRVIYWVGTRWWLNEGQIAPFERSCRKNGIDFRVVGAGTHGILSIEDNIRLIRESLMAPAIIGEKYLKLGMVTCRSFKNVAYGHYPVTNSALSNQLFGGMAICDWDTGRLFDHAREQLARMPVQRLWEMMDLVAKKHTYVNRIAALMKAARLILGAAE